VLVIDRCPSHPWIARVSRGPYCRQRHSTGPRLGDESKQNFALVVPTEIDATLCEHPALSS
jgi:hypothetical protein